MLDVLRRQFLSYSASGVALVAAGEVVGAPASPADTAVVVAR